MKTLYKSCLCLHFPLSSVLSHLDIISFLHHDLLASQSDMRLVSSRRFSVLFMSHLIHWFLCPLHLRSKSVT